MWDPRVPNRHQARLTTGRGPSHRETPRGAKSGPLEAPNRTTNRTRSRCHQCARPPTESWRVGGKDAEFLIPAFEAALASGWTLENLIPHISQNPGGVRSPARVLSRRLADLPHPPPRPCPCPPTIAWCGECEDVRSRTVTIAMPDGTEAAAFCPRCSPQAQRKTRDSYPYVKEVN
jgi:hypothetical protein